MTDTPNRPPLWQEMKTAGARLVMANLRVEAGPIYAAEIRALRDWLVPETDPCPDMAIEALLRDERQRLRAILTAEAERAERGE